jgi:hypothetical protein
MIKIGSRELIRSVPNLIVPKGDQVSVDMEHQGWIFKVSIRFKDDAVEQAIDIVPIDGGVELVFCKWTNPLGDAIKEPAHLARLSDGTSIEIMVSNYRIVDTNVFSIQFLHNRGV